MLATLIESRRSRSRGIQAQAVSFGVHAALIAGAVAATQHAVSVLEPPTIEQPPRFVRTVEAPAPTTTINSPRFGFRLIPTVIAIPSVLPDIDLSRPFTDPTEYLVARGEPGGDPRGAATSSVPTAMTSEQVDRVAHLLPGSARPVYPEALRSAGVGGEVNVQFEIDSLGRADMQTVAIISSTHARFTESVKRALEKARFAPAKFGGKKVRQVVRMPFVFSLEKR